MRSTWTYLSALALFLWLSSPIVASKRYPIFPRETQEPSLSESTLRSEITSSVKASGTRQPDSASSSINSKLSQPSVTDGGASDGNAETGKNTSPSKTSTQVASTSLPATSNASSSISATHTVNGTSNAPNREIDSDGLPIHPAITPALSVAGAYLILSGGVYLLIGIKTKWLHIFLSAAYLTSLAVTILIIYVMHPPISNAIQGAYFIAAFLTGVAFGGGSVVFADVTEGLGCLLGGFCLSMWFLILKPGGLLTSTAGKAIFISCFTLGAFGFYVSHYTRPYGLIGCISFAGASVIVLGIDCFSRAGLKEFWLFIWALNDDLFPPHYNQPYPISRGIRVEIACTILLFLLGIMSQMKVWKIIRERRAQKAKAESEEAQRREKAEEDLGRRLEEGNGQERAIWEAVYGDHEHSKRQQTHSGIDTDTSESLRKGSLSAVGIREMRNSGSESIEMRNLDAQGSSSQKVSHDESVTQENSRVTISDVPDDVIQQAPPSNAECFTSRNRFSEVSAGTSILDPTASMTKIVPSPELVSTASNLGLGSSRNHQDSGPKIVPLPFTIPGSDAGQNDNDDASSIATFAASEHIPRGSKGMSGNSLLRSLSRRSQRHSRNTSTSEEALIVPHIEDDQASSVAATVDDISTDRDEGYEAASVAEELAKSSDDSKKDLEGVNPMSGTISPIIEKGDNGILDGVAKTDGLPENDMVDPNKAHPNVDHPEPFTGDAFAVVRKSEKPTQSPVSSKNTAPTFTGEASRIRRSPANSEISDTRSNPVKLRGNLPGSTSKIVMAYRTNEWAKHLGGAETPELDDISDFYASNPVNEAETKEAVVPVRISDLQQTPLTAEPAPMSINRDSQQAVDRSRSTVSRVSVPQHVENPRRQASGGNMERSSSQTSLQSTKSRRDSSNATLNKPTSSQISLANGNRGFRSSSTPLVTSPFVESPIEEGVESSFPIRFTPSPMHLMSHRENMVRNRMSSTSLNRTTSSSSLSPITSPSNEALIPQPLPTLDEDVSLSARRKSILQQNISRSTPALAQPNHSSSLQNPARSTSNPRESTLSAWRSSLRADLPTQQAAQHEIETRRSEMIHEKRRASTTQQWAQMEAERRESGMDLGMRRGDFMDKHREAMRKMQSEANRRL